MPEYLAPGVYVEEIPGGIRPIEGVSTSTTAFAGATVTGPLDDAVLVTSLAEFRRVFGGFERLRFGTLEVENHMAQAVRAFFENGGGRLYVARVYAPASPPADPNAPTAAELGLAVLDQADGAAAATATFVARFPGRAEGARVTTTRTPAPVASRTRLDRLPPGALIEVRDGPAGSATTTLAVRGTDGAWTDGDGDTFTVPDPAGADTAIDVVTMSVAVVDADGDEVVTDDLGFGTAHPRFAGAVLGAEPPRRSEQLTNAFRLALTGSPSAIELHDALFGADGVVVFTAGSNAGSDGGEPTATAVSAALRRLARIEDISIVAAPGAVAYTDGGSGAIADALVAHAEARRAYRIAVLDAPRDGGLAGARQFRARLDSSHAALYYPWVVTTNPRFVPGADAIPREVAVAPSGFVCGIYARTDVERGVYKAPANEVVRGALRFDDDINFAEQEILNPLGVNALRFFPGRGLRVWGARTAGSDPEFRYVNVRRYFLFLEASLDRGLQWAVFEPNGERLWAAVRESIGSFLYAEWRAGALLGASPREAFFVRCDRSTMTEADILNGRLIARVGVAPLRPAEFVVIRLQQKTASSEQ